MTKKLVQWWKEQTQRGKHFLLALVPAGLIVVVATIFCAMGMLSEKHYILVAGFGSIVWMGIFSFVPYKHSSLLD